MNREPKKQRQLTEEEILTLEEIAEYEAMVARYEDEDDTRRKAEDKAREEEIQSIEQEAEYRIGGCDGE